MLNPNSDKIIETNAKIIDLPYPNYTSHIILIKFYSIWSLLFLLNKKNLLSMLSYMFNMIKIVII